MHMYITSALQKTDMKAVGLQLALELLHQKVVGKSVSGRSMYNLCFSQRGTWSRAWRLGRSQAGQTGTKSSEISRTTGARPIFENLSCLNLPTTNLCIFQEGTCDRVFLWPAPTEQNPQTEVQRLWLRLQKGELLVQQESNNPSQWDRENSRCQWSWSYFVSCKKRNWSS